MAVADYLDDDELYDYIYGNTDIDVDDLVTSDLNGVYGIPYQFMDTVDRRLENSDLGRKYADKIVSRMPLLFIAPGKQAFMDDFDEEDTESVTNFLFGSATGTTSGDAEDLISGRGRYYSFEYDYADYYNYVNQMANSVAYFMQLEGQKVTVGGTTATLGRFDWSKAASSNFASYFSAKENVIFYLNGLTEVSESFSNGTTESSLASTLNGYSETVNEIKFLLGGSDSVISNLLDYGSDITTSLTNSLSGVVNEIGGGILSSLTTKGVSAVLSGGKIIFPKIWQDSSFDRSYSLDIKLRSPDNDPVSIYLNIIVPYIHLLALCLPRQIEDDPNGYSSPFLVKCFCKGMFNVDMGMVTSMSVTKGGEQNWTDDGIPSQIDVNLTIEDLYSSLSMSSLKNSISDIVNNTAMLDFLANMAGLNLAQPEIARRTKYKLFLIREKTTSIPSRIWNKFDQAITRLEYKLYQKI